MPNTKSAERRVRGNERKRVRNHAVKSNLRSLEKKFNRLTEGGKKDEASTELKKLISAFDKAAKGGVVHKATVDRKKSRLTLRLNRTGTPPAPKVKKAKAAAKA